MVSGKTIFAAHEDSSGRLAGQCYCLLMMNAAQMNAANLVLAAVTAIGYEATEEVVAAYANVGADFNVAVDYLLEIGLLWPSGMNAVGGRIVSTLRLT